MLDILNTVLIVILAVALINLYWERDR